MCIMTDGSEKPLPAGAVLLTDNKISKVWRGRDGWIYKRSTPYLIQNSYHFLSHMSVTGFVPVVELYDKYTIRTRDLGQSQPITDLEVFTKNWNNMLDALKIRGVRHGDLTTKAVIVCANRPYLIDFAESRYEYDPAPDKRPEGDDYWAAKTYEELTRDIRSA